jgi:hypothetical protein
VEQQHQLLSQHISLPCTWGLPRLLHGTCVHCTPTLHASTCPHPQHCCHTTRVSCCMLAVTATAPGATSVQGCWQGYTYTNKVKRKKTRSHHNPRLVVCEYSRAGQVGPLLKAAH